MISGKLQCYEWAGLTLRIIDPPDILDHPVQKMFELNQIPPCSHGIDIRLTIETDDDFFHTMPAWVYDFFQNKKPSDDPYIEYEKDQSFVTMTKGFDSGAYAICHPPYEKLSIVTQVFKSDKRPLLFNTVLFPALREILLDQGKALIHSGCVVTPAGDAFLIIADSGGGKTSTSISLTRQGFKFISDDLITLSVSDNQIVAQGIVKPVNLTQKTIGFFPELAFLQKEKQRSGDYKIPVDSVKIFKTDGIISSAPVSTIIIPHISKKGPALKPLKIEDVLPILIKGHTFAKESVKNKQSMKLLWTTLEQCKSYQLSTGNDPIQLGAWLADKASHGFFGRPFILEKDTQISHSTPKPKRKRLSSSIDNVMFKSWLGQVLNFSLDGIVSNEKPALELSAPDVFQSAWERIEFHRLEAIAAKWFLESDPGKILPKWIDSQKIIATATTYFHTLCSTADRVINALNRLDIHTILLRGPGFANAYYNDPWLRHCRDIDIICRKKDIPRAEKTLIDLGFNPFGNKAFWEKQGELPFKNSELTIELHWDAYPQMSPKRKSGFEFDTYFATADSVFPGNTKIKCLDPNHLLLSSCLHAAWEHKLDRLIRLIDIRQLLKKQGEKIDWEWIIYTSDKSNNKQVLGLVLKYAKTLVNAQVPQGVLDNCLSFSMLGTIGHAVLPDHAILSKQKNSSSFRNKLLKKLMNAF
ncbi:MAG: nucleotidyltransferase family protein [Pseudomonadota bacterium]